MSAEAMAQTHPPVLEVRGLVTRIGTGPRVSEPVRGVDLTVHRGETLGLVGESGSGKTMTAMSVAGLLPPTGAVAAGSILLNGTDVVGLPARQQASLRAATIGVVFQNPMTALNPRMTVGAQVVEALHGRPDHQRARRYVRATELLAQVGLSEPRKRLSAYPHELSGGIAQRVVIALALARDPLLLIADEPTTALDVRVQAEILDLVERLKTELDMGVLLVSHDLALVTERSARIAVMYGGEIVESGPARRVVSAPEARYTASLVASHRALLEPRRERRSASSAAETTELVSTQAVVREFSRGGGLWGRGSDPVRAVAGVDLVIGPGEAVGIVGESGSGKSTMGRIIAGLDRPTSGRVYYRGRRLEEMRRTERLEWRRRVQLIYQDPYASLDPRMTVRRLIAQPLRYAGVPRREWDATIEQVMGEVGLETRLLGRRPSGLSGGQRQRVGIARALTLEPELIVADESTSALDVSVQATILALLRRLQASRGLAYLFISHDLSVVSHLCDRIVVMNGGRVVESGATTEVLSSPADPYTRALLDAQPLLDPDGLADSEGMAD